MEGGGKLVPELPLMQMIERCKDFKNEVSQLKYIGKCLGMRMMITTKYHAKYVGEGVEYSWGLSKSVYRRHYLSAKKGKSNFKALVNKCISCNVITVKMARKLSKRAQGYMLAYLGLDEKQKEDSSHITCITHQMIKKMKKVMSSHRAALEFD